MSDNTKPYKHQDEMPGSHRAAERIVPVILSITGPLKSIVDVGGGDGGWLKTFQRHGVDEVFLFDSAEVEPQLQIDRTFFHAVDLCRSFPAPRRVDLALCLECAEHLPPHRALPLVEWLTQSSDMVVFSAAIPGQGGKGHINEMPTDYWSDLFRRNGFRRHDVLRGRIVHDRLFPFWYRQNMFIFTPSQSRFLENEMDFLPDEFRLIHEGVGFQNPGLRVLLRHLGPALMSAITKRTVWRRPET